MWLVLQDYSKLSLGYFRIYLKLVKLTMWII